MKKIGLYLSSNELSGGSFQYNINFINIINKLFKKNYKITYIYTDKVWNNYIPKSDKKIFLPGSIYKKIFQNLIKIKLIKKIIYFIIIFFEKLLKINILKIKRKNNALDNLKLDVIIFPSQDFISYQIKTKSIVTIHDLMHRYSDFDEYSIKEKEIRDIHYKAICNRARVILVDSNMGKNHVLESYKCKENKLIVFPFKPPAYLYEKKKINVIKKYNLPKNYLFYPANFWEHKNHINLLYALKILIQKGYDFNLVFSGQIKNNYLNVVKLIHTIGLKKNVTFLGYTPSVEMYSLYKNSFATIFASFIGPTNIPPLEAIYCNSPLVCSSAYAMKEQVGDAGLFFDPNNAFEIANHIISLKKNKNLKKQLIKNSRKKLKDLNLDHSVIILKKILKSKLLNI